MKLSMVLELLLLVSIGVGWTIVLSANRRRKNIERRIATTVIAGVPVKPQTGVRVQLLQRESVSKFQIVAKLLRMPLDLPLAHVIRPFWVFVIGTLIASAVGSCGHFLVSESTSTVVGIVVWVAVTRGIFSWEITRYRTKLVTQLPDAVQLVVSATRAGLPVSEAFKVISAEMPSPTRDEFIRVEAGMAVGDTPDQALLALFRRTGVPEYSIFAVTIGVQARSGGRLAETMENLAETIRERLAIMARAKALAGEAKVSAVIMCLLPGISGLVMSIIQPKQMAFLFTDPRGQGMLTFGITTMTIGILTMRQLIAGVSKD